MPVDAGNRSCLVCGARGFDVFLERRRLPALCNALWSTREGALGAARGDIRLGICSTCGYIRNLAFDPDLVRYAGAYDASIWESPHFRGYLTALADRLVDRHGLHGKAIIEIGCGHGEFLRLLCDRGDNSGLGFDPSFVPEAGPVRTDERVRIAADVYDERHADRCADFVCSRQTLEHAADPRALLTAVRRGAAQRAGTAVFFEVPDGGYMLREGAVWDVIYEHPSYFSRPSLVRLFAETAFDVSGTITLYDGQYLGIEAVSGLAGTASWSGPSPEVAELVREAAAFGHLDRQVEAHWRAVLDGIVTARRRAVVWGAGSKGVTFLNRLDPDASRTGIVDASPHKQGKYVPGTGHRILGPSALRDDPPDVVIVMNRVYAREIASTLAALGLGAEIMVC